jgi:hypothetical protein
MFRRSALALALISAMTGCSARPVGPFVEYHEGLEPVTREVTREATYALHSTDDPSAPLVEHHLARGERIGFRCEPDGAVSAVGPGCVLALAPGAYCWDVVRGTEQTWRERVWHDARDPLRAAGAGAVGLVEATCLLAIGAGLLFAVARGGASSSSPLS